MIFDCVSHATQKCPQSLNPGPNGPASKRRTMPISILLQLAVTGQLGWPQPQERPPARTKPICFSHPWHSARGLSTLLKLGKTQLSHPCSLHSPAEVEYEHELGVRPLRSSLPNHCQRRPRREVDPRPFRSSHRRQRQSQRLRLAHLRRRTDAQALSADGLVSQIPDGSRLFWGPTLRRRTCLGRVSSVIYRRSRSFGTAYSEKPI